MRLLLDQDVYAVTARFLVDTGHDVVLVAQIGLSQASDEEYLEQHKNRTVFSSREIETTEILFLLKQWDLE